MGPKVMTTELGFMFRYTPTKPMLDYAALVPQKPFNLRFVLSSSIF